MTPGDFNRSVLRSFQILIDCGLSDWDWGLRLGILKVPESYKRVAFSKTATYQEIYTAGIATRSYNYLLIDGSFFQFSGIQGNRGQITELRYGFYPIPYDLSQYGNDLGRVITQEIINDEDANSVYDAAPLALRAMPVRYDLCLKSYRPYRHPAAHLHFDINGRTRLAVERKYSPLMFSLLMARLFYPAEWERMTSADPDSKFPNLMDRHLSCARADSSLLDTIAFSADERQHPYLA